MGLEIFHYSIIGTLEIDTEMFHATEGNFISVLAKLRFLQLAKT